MELNNVNSLNKTMDSLSNHEFNFNNERIEMKNNKTENEELVDIKEKKTSNKKLGNLLDIRV
jgi:hypothetical protein